MSALKAITPKGEITITFDNFKFEVIEPKNNWDTPSVYIDADNIQVKLNGSEQENFGESFAGHRYTIYDVFESTITAYINNNTAFQWVEIPDEVKNEKNKFFSSRFTVNGREVPDRFIYGAYIVDLKILSDGSKNPNYYGNAAYTDFDGNFILTDHQGNILTDMEVFWLSGVEQIWKKDNIIYGKDYIDQLAKNYEFERENYDKKDIT